MFSSIQYRGKVATVNADLDWGADLPATLELVGRYFADFNDNGFYAHPDEEALRQELRDVATLHRLHRELGALKANGIALAGLGLKGLPEPQRNAALYALTLTLGYPTSTDQRTGRVAWDVKARPESGAGGRFSTFSERVGSADMHTDSYFYPMPEEQFILYVVRAARCNGGHSLLIDGEDIYHTLQQTAALPRAVDLRGRRRPGRILSGHRVRRPDPRRRPLHAALAPRRHRQGTGGAAGHEQRGGRRGRRADARRRRAAGAALQGAAARRHADADR